MTVIINDDYEIDVTKATFDTFEDLLIFLQNVKFKEDYVAIAKGVSWWNDILTGIIIKLNKG